MGRGRKGKMKGMGRKKRRERRGRAGRGEEEKGRGDKGERREKEGMQETPRFLRGLTSMDNGVTVLSAGRVL